MGNQPAATNRNSRAVNRLPEVSKTEGPDFVIQTSGEDKIGLFERTDF